MERLEFKPEDFCTGHPSEHHSVCGAKEIAAKANNRLAEMLEDAIVVSAEIQNPDAMSLTETGRPVKIKYDVRRVVFCGPDHWLTSVELMK